MISWIALDATVDCNMALSCLQQFPSIRNMTVFMSLVDHPSLADSTSQLTPQSHINGSFTRDLLRASTLAYNSHIAKRKSTPHLLYIKHPQNGHNKRPRRSKILRWYIPPPPLPTHSHLPQLTLSSLPRLKLTHRHPPRPLEHQNHLRPSRRLYLRTKIPRRKRRKHNPAIRAWELRITFRCATHDSSCAATGIHTIFWWLGIGVSGARLIRR